MHGGPIIPRRLRQGHPRCIAGRAWAARWPAGLRRGTARAHRVTGRFATGALETFLLAAGAGYQWVCECFTNYDLLRFDPRTRTAIRFPIPQVPLSWRTSARSIVPRTFLVGLDRDARQLWILGALGHTIVPWDPK